MKAETRTLSLSLSPVIMNVRKIKSRGDSARGREETPCAGDGSIFADHFVIGGNDSFLPLSSFFSLSFGHPARPVLRSYFQLERELTFHSRRKRKEKSPASSLSSSMVFLLTARAVEPARIRVLIKLELQGRECASRELKRALKASSPGVVV